MAHSHSHRSLSSDADRRLIFSLVITLLFVVGEAVAAYWANSLALLSDAGHNFADALSIVLSLYAIWMAKRPLDSKYTFGYHRVEILVALVNAATLILVAFYIFLKAFHRFGDVLPVQSGPMIWVSIVAVAINGAICLGLRSDAGHNLNVRSVYIHILGDALSAVGVLIAGISIRITGSSIADPIASILIGFLILWSSYGILSESLQVLMEGIPAGVDLEVIEADVKSIPSVKGIHNLHVWSVSSGIHACSCHVTLSEPNVNACQPILRAISEKLADEYGIVHTTIQIEVAADGQNGSCNITKKVKHAG